MSKKDNDHEHPTENHQQFIIYRAFNSKKTMTVNIQL